MTQSAKGQPPQEVLETARRGWAAPAGEVALRAGHAAFARAGFSDPTFVLRWPSIAGEEIARIATPAKWQEGEDGAVLTLKCDAGSAVFLQHQTRALAERLNAYLGAGRIARIKCVPSSREAPPASPPHPGLGRPLPPPAPEDRDLKLSEALDRLSKARENMGNTRPSRLAD
jgi:hypothetical protein